MTTFNVLTLFIGSATWVAALLGLLSFLTVKKQHRLAMQPQLTLVRQRVRGVGRGEGLHGIHEIRWAEVQDLEEDPVPEDARSQAVYRRPRDYGARLFNLGNGSAKSITARWEVEYASIVARINELAERASVNNVWQYDSEKNTLKFDSKEGPRITYFPENNLTTYHDYILPCAVEHKGLNIELPRSFIHLVSDLVSVCLIQKDANFDELNNLENLIKIRLLLTFDDIAGNKYSIKHVCRLELYELGANGAFEATWIPERCV